MIRCARCRSEAPDEARFCPFCGHLVPQADADVRRRLLDAFLELASSEHLSMWLAKLGQEPRGSDATKRARIREHTRYVTMPVDGFPQQTIRHLERLDGEALVFVCQKLGLPDQGMKRILLRRIVRHACTREQWLPANPWPVLQDVVSFFTYFPLLDPVHEERELYPEIQDELLEVFGDDQVFAQQALPRDSDTSIDFHVGSPRDGVGIELELPRTNLDCQRALGPIEQYLGEYGTGRLLLVAVDDELPSAIRTRFSDALAAKGVTHLFKQQPTS